LTVAIVGAGLIGTSVALAARRADAGARVVTLDRGDSLDGAAGADLVVLATPVEVIIDLLDIASHRFPDVVITDVGSTKRLIVTAAREAGLSQFVGGHPMAGAASTGPAAARADLFDGRPWFLVPHGAGGDAVTRVREFVGSLGARPVTFDDDGAEHDRLMAAVSHLPQVTASALMKVVGEAAGTAGLQWAGEGLNDTTRLSAGAASVWRSILVTNAAELRPLLHRLAAELTTMANGLDDEAVVQQLFEAAGAYRRALDAGD
jgi:prephenate dehydrogenase